jgi:hypothetical protein
VAWEVASRLEADAIVYYLEGYLLWGALHLYLHVAGPSVLDGVVEGFLGDAVNGLLHLERSLRLVAEGGHNIDPVAGLKGIRLFL